MENYKPTVGVIGLGYVGLPVAVHMSKKFEVIGFDVNEARINELLEKQDSTKEVTSEELQKSSAAYTHSEDRLKKVDFFIVAVPTPIDSAKNPNLKPLISASETVGRNLKKGDIVVYESTVYPGATEDDCIPVLEQVSGLKAGVDFKVGYSPERINPGDKERTFDKIIKVVSAQDAESLEKVSYVYSSVVEAGVFEATSIKVAEAAKVIENTQRDLNIALMNELSVIFDKIDVPILDVLDAAGTKWNFLKFVPGLVGGHCIGVDPYYLTYKALKLNHQPEVIMSGRKINDSMSKFIVEKLLKNMVRLGFNFKGASINIYGLTFKENCPDTRNSKVFDIISELKSYGFIVNAIDPLISKEDADLHSDLNFFNLEAPPTALASIVTVSHNEFKELNESDFNSDLIFDIKGIYKNRNFSKKIINL